MTPFLKTCLTAARGLMKYHQYEVQGMEHVPREGPALIVVNHSLATYDSILLGAAIYLETGRYAAGLADRRIFQTPGLSQLFAGMGAVEGTPEAGQRILRQGHLLVVSPGGMRESLRPSSRRYEIRWRGRLGFARLAINAQAPVLLAACPTADDIYRVYANPLTPLVYRYLIWPLPFARVVGPTIIPRRVKLVHHLRPLIYPPPLQKGKADDRDVRMFQAQLEHEMDELMAEASPRSGTD
jgi:1-acyl-sn-glycerol-3-phosphate acyltransferase